MSLLSKIFGTNDKIIKDPIQPQPAEDKPDAQDQNAPDPNNSEPGFMAINDVFEIKNRGTVVVGHVDSGYFFINQVVTINTSTGPIQATIGGIECFRKIKKYASPGENVGLLLKDVEKNLLAPNDTIRGM